MSRYPTKYGSRKVTYNGIQFASKKEANRYCELLLLERAGAITDLQTQVPFVLIPAQYEIINGKRKCVERECKYIADFVYTENGRQIVEDVKGYKESTAYSVFVLKRKLMLYLKNIKVIEV
jgi:hypothetical protein